MFQGWEPDADALHLAAREWLRTLSRAALAEQLLRIDGLRRVVNERAGRITPAEEEVQSSMADGTATEPPLATAPSAVVAGVVPLETAAPKASASERSPSVAFASDLPRLPDDDDLLPEAEAGPVRPRSCHP